MGGRAALLLVLGFAAIFGYLNLQMHRLTGRAVENMVGYNEIMTSRNLANAGANVGIAKIFCDKSLRHTIASQSFSDGPFAGGAFNTTFELTSDTTMVLTSISNYATSTVTLSDTVIVSFKGDYRPPFCYWGWLTNTENGVYFITGDSIFGRVHSNGNINISGSPYFKEMVTTSGVFKPAISTKWKPTTNKAIFDGGHEEGVAKREFPDDLSETASHATNDLATRTQELWVDIKPGTSAEDDGYAIIRTGSFTGPQVDSVALTSGKVIYSSANIHVQGVLDGGLTICSNSDLIIENNVTYERNPRSEISSDVLGLVANNNVRIPESIKSPGITIDGSIFCLKGSFTADNYDGRSIDGHINILGSVTQNIRGAIGTFSGGVIKHGFLKNYRFDERMNDGSFAPPFFPGAEIRTLQLTDWWESYGAPMSF